MALIAVAAMGGLGAVAVGILVLTWVLTGNAGNTKPVQAVAQDAAKTSKPTAADPNTRSPLAQAKLPGGSESALPPTPQVAKPTNTAPKASDVVEEFVPANLTKLVGRRVRWSGTTLGATSAGQPDLMLVIRPGFMANVSFGEASMPALTAQSSVTFEGTYEGVVGNIGGFSAGGTQTGGADILGIKNATVIATKEAPPTPEKKLAETPVLGNPVQEPPVPLSNAGEGATDANKAPASVGGFKGRSKPKSRP